MHQLLQPAGRGQCRIVSALCGLLLLGATGTSTPCSRAAEPTAGAAAKRPNVLWITSEDNGPQLGAYGDRYAKTPHLDALAARGVVYRHAWSNAPVCAPARTTIISGVYPPALGAEHMRSQVPLPPNFQMYPQLLRAAGYYCTNNRKEDYNLEKNGKVWDESSGNAHWKNRAEGQPFFAIFNHTVTHESQIRQRPHQAVHDPQQVRVPAYHPDTPEVRQDWAQYYDKLTALDDRVGQNLRELEEAGLADETIVVYYGDHGPGMPRCKRWPYNSGLHVPLIVYIPPKFQHLASPDYEPGGSSDRLVAFVDLAPTLLSLADIQPPAWMQGHAFLGPYATDPPRWMYGFRGRMDERYDLVRTVGDGRYVYIRNFMPHRIYGQYLDYMFQTPTTRVWRRMYDAGQLTAPQTYFWEPKPSEELYDLQADPDEVHNLAGSPDHQEILTRMRQALTAWQLEIRDVGMLPEAEMHRRAGEDAPYTMGHSPARFPLPSILAMAQQATLRSFDDIDSLQAGLEHQDSGVRYWAATGLLIRESNAVDAARDALSKCLSDPSPSVRIVAAEALVRFGDDQDRARALPRLAQLANLQEHGLYVALAALNAIDSCGDQARPVLDTLRAAPRKSPQLPGRLSSYVPRLMERILNESGT